MYGNKLLLLMSLRQLHILSIIVFCCTHTAYAWDQSPVIEICDNALDDDNDGLIDINDPDCQCLEFEQQESLIPNPSFEMTDCCPELQSELDCATEWEQASAPTTDFIHACGWLGWDGSNGSGEVYPPPMPFPDGEGIVGFRDGVTSPPGGPNETGIYEPNWKEYAGACLSRPMLKDSLYRIELDVGFVNRYVSPTINITIYGTSDCINLPFGPSNTDDLVGCPTNTEGWVKLGHSLVFGGDGNKWVHTSIEFIPENDILAVAIGPDCNDNLDDRSLYYFLDNLILDEAESFEFVISEMGHPCSPDFSLSISEYPGTTYQWYLDGIALLGETDASMSQNYGEGQYQVLIENENGCSIHSYGEYEIPIETVDEEVVLCPGEGYLLGDIDLEEPGFYVDTLISENGCDSIVMVNLSFEEDEQIEIEAQMIPGIDFVFHDHNFTEPGVYEVTIISENGCEQTVVLYLSDFDFYLPNIFTPNSQDNNSSFTLFTPQEFEYDFEISIYDRWGNLIFIGSEWDGFTDKGPAMSGVYTYLVEISDSNDQSTVLPGIVSLVR